MPNPNQRAQRLRFLGAILLTAAIAFASGAYVATVLITESVKQEMRSADRIK